MKHVTFVDELTVPRRQHGDQAPNKESTHRIKNPAHNEAKKTAGKRSADHSQEPGVGQKGQLQDVKCPRQMTLKRGASCSGTRGHTQSQKERCWPRGHEKMTCHRCLTLFSRQELLIRRSLQGPPARHLYRKTSRGSGIPCPFGTSTHKQITRTSEAGSRHPPVILAPKPCRMLRQNVDSVKQDMLAIMNASVKYFRLNSCVHKLHQHLYGGRSTRAMKTNQVVASSNEKDENATQSEDLLPELPLIHEINLSFNRVWLRSGGAHLEATPAHAKNNQ